MRWKCEELVGIALKQVGYGEMTWRTDLTVLLLFEAIIMTTVLEQRRTKEEDEQTAWLSLTEFRGWFVIFATERVSSPHCHLKKCIYGHLIQSDLI
jgi:hypothetical protein